MPHHRAGYYSGLQAVTEVGAREPWSLAVTYTLSAKVFGGPVKTAPAA